MGSELSGRWTLIELALKMMVLHKVHSWTPGKIMLFLHDTYENQHVCPCVEVVHYSNDSFRTTSNLLHCLFSKFSCYLIFGALFQFLFSFDQPNFIHVTSNLFRFQSRLFVESSVALFVQSCLYWCIGNIYEKQKTLIFHLHFLVFQFHSSLLFNAFLRAVPPVCTLVHVLCTLKSSAVYLVSEHFWLCLFFS